MVKEIGIMDVGGFKIGHSQNTAAATGCTVLIFDKMAPAGLDVRGGGPASRESQILSPLAAAESINAILLSGGSAFGLDAAGGVQKYLEERGEGFAVGPLRVPLVSQSCVFDLGVGRHDVRPDAAMGYSACINASNNAPEEGNIGVGIGCSVGKYRGMERAMKSGFGTFAIQAGDIKVGAAVAVNALGDIYENGRQIAGLMASDKSGVMSMIDELFADIESAAFPTGNTTIGVILTNAEMAKAQLCKISGMAHNGYARAIRPVHTTADGDSIYAVSLGKVKTDVNTVGIMAAYAMEKAVVQAVKSAKSAYGLKAFCDME